MALFLILTLHSDCDNYRHYDSEPLSYVAVLYIVVEDVSDQYDHCHVVRCHEAYRPCNLLSVSLSTVMRNRFVCFCR